MALRSADGRTPPFQPLTADQCRPPDGVNRMRDDAESLFGQQFERRVVGDPVCKNVDFLRSRRLAEDRDDIGQRAFPTSNERPDDLGAEAAAGPAGRHNKEARDFAEPRCLEVDHGRLNLAGQPRLRLSVERCGPDRARRARGQDRSRPDKVLVHAAILAWRSATWVAHCSAPTIFRSTLAGPAEQ